MKLLLQDVRQEDKVSKNGKPYTACSIKANNVYYNGFGNKSTQDWKIGDEVEVEVYEEEYNGKMYKKFRALSDTQRLALKVEELEKRVKSLETLKASKIEEKEDDLPPLPF